MSKMVERVARAIAAKDGYDSWSHAHKLTVDHYTGLARVAIEAMREPTEGMVDAGYDFTADPCWREDFVKAWQACIDEALR